MIAPFLLLMTATAASPAPARQATVEIVASVTIIAPERFGTATAQPAQRREGLDRAVRRRDRAIIIEYY